jgi:transcriptional regulator with XRE-family HTH domain
MVGDARVIADHFGENLRIHRRRALMSQEELAFRAELHRTEIGMLERGIRLPRLDTIVKLVGGLEIDAGLLFDGLVWTGGSPRSGSFSVPNRLTPQRRGAES